MSDNLSIYLNHIAYPVTNLGPGRRICIWLEGCPFNCNGCMALSMKKQRSEDRKTVKEIFSVIEQSCSGLDGVTISGGEPFYQVEGLRQLVDLIKDKTSLNIMVYSGYSIEELKETGKDVDHVLSMIDILIDGRFENKTTNTKLWRGSDNQRLLILSKMANKYAHFIDAEYDQNRPIAFEISPNHELRIIGIPDRGFFQELGLKLQGKGLFLPWIEESNFSRMK
jgi:anaerobic ribonucleoside-triphosphate reductase activating protein